MFVVAVVVFGISKRSTCNERFERDTLARAPLRPHTITPQTQRHHQKTNTGSWDALGIHLGTSGQGGTWADDTVKNIVKQHNKYVNAY